MHLIRLVSLALLHCVLMGAVSTTDAQRSGDIEAGGFGSYTTYDHALPYENTIGGGGRLSLFFVRHLAFEGDLLFTETVDPTSRILTHVAARGRLLFDINPLPWGVLNRLHLLLGAGAVHNEYRLQSRGADIGPSGLGGLRVTLAQPLSVRIEAIADYVPETVLLDDTPTNALNWTVQAGISLHLRFRGGGIGSARGSE